MPVELVNLIRLLPSYEDVVKLTANQAEAEYILGKAAKYFAQNDDHCDSQSNGIFFLVDSLLDRMWEKINTGHFSEVPEATRKIYSLCCYYIIIFALSLAKEKKFDLCNEYMDKAKIIGSTDGLYANSESFLNNLSSYLDQNQAANNATQLPQIEPLKNEDFPCDIPRLDCPSLTEFVQQCFDKKHPALLRSTINHWPALSKWRDLNYLLKVAGNRLVPIEIGSNYASENWSQQLIQIKDFLRRQFDKTGSSDSCEVEYLAQHELFDQIPALKQDISIPDYCMHSSDRSDADRNAEISIKAWLGPVGTISPMHHDPSHNILCQVFGSKRIILASADYTDDLYPHENAMLGNTSQIDAEHLDFDRFPRLKNVKFLHLVLQEGECLYIPPKWWHYVRSLSSSFSVSFWWS